MLIITSEQMQHFEQHRHAMFLKQDLVPFAKTYFSVDFHLLGEEAFYHAVKRIAVKGLDKGFDSKGEQCRWTTLCFALGIDFDKDPLIPWSGAKCEKHTNENNSEYLSRLERMAQAYIKNVAGEKGELFCKALVALNRMPQDTFKGILTNPGRDSSQIKKLFEKIYPEKFERVPNGHWELFFNVVNKVSEKNRFNDLDHVALATTLFVLGTYASSDPLHNWIHFFLENKSASPETEFYGVAKQVLTLSLNSIREI